MLIAAFNFARRRAGGRLIESHPLQGIPLGESNARKDYFSHDEQRIIREYMIEDQRFADQRPDVLSWSTPELKLDITMAGELTADLWVHITGTDADFIVKIIDARPNTVMHQ